jgi:hypothetical protein
VGVSNIVNKSKIALVTSQIVEKIQFIIGILILFVFGVCTIVSITDPTYGENGFLQICIIFDALGFLLIYLSHKRNKLIKNFKVYVAKLSVNSTGSIESLAAAINTSQDVVKANLKKMIDKKYFVNAYVDEMNNCIVFPGNSQTASPMVKMDIGSMPQQQQQYIQYQPINCKNCGGITNVALGQICECDFCGAPIIGK